MNRSQLRGDLPEPVRRYFSEVAKMQPPSDLLDAAVAEIERTPRVNRFTALASLGVAAAAVVLGFLALNFLPSGPSGIGTDPSPTSSGGQSPSPVPVATHPALETLPSAGSITARYDVGDAGHPVLYAHGSVWLSNPAAGILSRLNPQTGEITGSVEVNPDPGDTQYDLSAVTDEEFVWATGSDNTLVKIDPTTNQILERIDIGTLIYRMVIDEGDLWLTNLDQGFSVVRVDLAAGDVLFEAPHPQWPAGLAITDAGLWMTPYQDGRLVQLDPETGEVVARFTASMHGMQILPLGDSLYINGNQERPVERFSISEGRVVASTADLGALASEGDRLYGLRWDGAFVELDPATLELTAGLAIEGGETGTMVLADGLFVVGQGSDVVIIDPRP